MYKNDLKIESEKAQVRISSLSNFQSFVSIVVYNKDMKIESEKAQVRITSVLCYRMKEAHFA